jgi:hypothetical protein
MVSLILQLPECLLSTAWPTIRDAVTWENFILLRKIGSGGSAVTAQLLPNRNLERGNLGLASWVAHIGSYLKEIAIAITSLWSTCVIYVSGAVRGLTRNSLGGMF